MRLMIYLTSIFVLIFLALWISCGGGGDDDDEVDYSMNDKDDPPPVYENMTCDELLVFHEYCFGYWYGEIENHCGDPEAHEDQWGKCYLNKAKSIANNRKTEQCGDYKSVIIFYCGANEDGTHD